jgi:hypothetical protein
MYRNMICYLVLILFLSCNESSNSMNYKSELIKRDSLLKKLVLDNYGIPFTMSNGYFDNDTLILDRLLSDFSYENSLKRSQLDSIITDDSIMKLLPKYNPAYRNKENLDFLRFIVDKSNYGDRRIEVYDIECEKKNCTLKRGVVSVDGECFGNSMEIPFPSTCYAFKDVKVVNLTTNQMKLIFSMYIESDIGRVVYYNHQSRLICDGLSIYVRRINSYQDKTTIIECPRDKNPILEIYSTLENLIK